MNNRTLLFSVVTPLVLASHAIATPSDSVIAPRGGTLSESYDSYLNLTSFNMSEDGALFLYSTHPESSPMTYDGGILIEGQPVRIGIDTTSTKGSFEIWDALVTNNPRFQINTYAKTSEFRGVDLTVGKDGTVGGNLIVEGTLTVNGKSVVTQGTAVAFGSTATAAGLNSFAGGTNAHASGISDFAWGLNASSTGSNNIALGSGATASGVESLALGKGSIANSTGSVAIAGGQANGPSALGASGAVVAGNNSIGAGEGLLSFSYSSAMFGRYNIYVAGSPSVWNDLDQLFTLGNGVSDTQRSSAMVTLKNGQATLTNKYWDPANPIATVTATGASAGEALVVKGNTRLSGKVVLEQPQGDISMGVYGAP